MRNVRLVFFFIAAELFSQGCDPIAYDKTLIKSKEEFSANTNDRLLEVIEVVESIARQSGFTPVSTSNHMDKLPLHMCKKNKDNVVTSIAVCSEDNIIEISILELGHRKLSEDALRLQDEIDNALSPSLKDCCIIIKDNNYSGRKH